MSKTKQNGNRLTVNFSLANAFTSSTKTFFHIPVRQKISTALKNVIYTYPSRIFAL